MLLANRSNWIHLFLASLMFIFFNLEAATPSKQQIEQFKKLPLSQQKALAKQFGIDVNSLMMPQTQAPLNSNTDMGADWPVERVEEELIDYEDEFEPKKEELTRFGYELFASEPSTFAPVSNAPVPANYILGPGDSVLINIYGKENIVHEVIVDREGSLVIPGMSPIYVTGLTYSEVKILVANQVKSQLLGVEASVSMGQLRTIRIFVLGESYKPGAYAVSSLSTITHALFVSGGITDIGSLRNIQLKRNGKVVNTLDLYDLLINGDNKNDELLKPGDVVFIPTVEKSVSISGEVRREAIFELKNKETFGDVIKMAGGLSPQAFAKNSSVSRFNGSNLKTILNVDLSKKSDLAKQPADGDEVVIGAVSNQYEGAVAFIGALERPGIFQWRKGARISNYLSSVYGEFLPTADLKYGLVVRETEQPDQIEVYQFAPGQAVRKRGSADDLVLQSRDKVVIFSRFESKAAENRLLEKYAKTEDEIVFAQKDRLWKKYQEKRFLEYIEAQSTDLLDSDDFNQDDINQANRSLIEITDEDKKAKPESYYSVFSRHRMLAPIILTLKEQAGFGKRVRLVEIDGRVKYPGVYPLAESGKVSDLINAAGGLDESAYLEKAEITRLDTTSSGTSIQHLTVNLGEVVTGNTSQDVALESKDRLNILPIPNWQENITVTLRGEVMFPGSYTIRRGEELSDVISRAGGFTDFADPKAAIFTRTSLRIKEKRQLMKLSNDLRREIAARGFQPGNSGMSTVNYAETKQLLDDLTNVDAVGRLVINLPSILTGNAQADVKLENGDMLHVPAQRQSINVIGEVNVSTAHMFEGALTISDYIERSGGYKQRADQSGVYVIKSNGAVVIPGDNSWFAVEKKVALEAGDTIVVPLDSEHMDNLSLWTSATQVIYQLAVAVAAIGSL